MTWYRRWTDYIESIEGSTVDSPGRIDNSDLFDAAKVGGLSLSNLREDATEICDFKCVPKEVWDTLVDWYGTVDGQVRTCETNVYLNFIYTIFFIYF